MKIRNRQKMRKKYKGNSDLINYMLKKIEKKHRK